MEQQPNKVTPSDFFLWIGAIVALYVSIVSMITLLFEYTDRVFGDSLTYVDTYSTAIRLSIASLIIIFPLYLWLTRVLNNSIRANPLKNDLWIRRWLLYFTLFIGGFTMAVDLIVLVQQFLGGEDITTAFLLKVATVLLVAGGAFIYYLYDIRGYWGQNERTALVVAGSVVVLVIAAIGAGFFIMGSPRTQRLMRYDTQKINDLQSIQYQVTNYYQQKGKLPASLVDLNDPLQGAVIPVDPQVSEGGTYTYEYKQDAPLTFELCATFNLIGSATVSGVLMQPVPAAYGPVGALETDHWQHKAEHTCFSRTIDPDKYPLYNKKGL